MRTQRDGAADVVSQYVRCFEAPVLEQVGEQFALGSQVDVVFRERGRVP